MKYFKQYKDTEKEPFEISKEEAINTLKSWWDEDALNDIFTNEKAFRLFTPVSEIWTMTDEGLVPIPGLYGVCE